MKLDRRQFLRATGFAGAAILLPPGLVRADTGPLSEAARAALSESPLVYISPLQKSGAESECHGEVWFVTDGDDVLLCTAADGWRARAVKGGLTRARLWVGDYGVWKRAGGKFREAPTYDSDAVFDADAAVREKALEAFGKKYPDEWAKWGPRFRDGLADGSRVLIRYKPAA
ncbi:MAG: hypothetical protein OEP95_07290 [Myxococcales bacterium]|nr:hypothetical protein [Myxococcales bacterium]